MTTRKETTSENIARDIREGRFPSKSEPQDVFVHITPKADACDHDFSGGVDLKDAQGRVCGFTTICTKCGMDAMTYSLRTGI